MESESKPRINIDAICVLKFEPNSELVMVDYETIPRTLDNDFLEIKALFKTDYYDAKSILARV